jgi:hypothetical protein
MSQYIRRYRPAGTTRIGRGGQHDESPVLQIAPLGSDPDKWTTDRITVHIGGSVRALRSCRQSHCVTGGVASRHCGSGPPGGPDAEII